MFTGWQTSGLRLTTAIAKLRTAAWARDFLLMLDKNGVKAHGASAYVDELRFFLDKLELGTRWTGGEQGGNPGTLAWREE